MEVSELRESIGKLGEERFDRETALTWRVNFAVSHILIFSLLCTDNVGEALAAVGTAATLFLNDFISKADKTEKVDPISTPKPSVLPSAKTP
jgi:hypothetical protein